MRRGKYGNKKTVVDGIAFASKREARRYGELRLLEKCGEISRLWIQTPYSLHVKEIKICTYIADFVYRDKNGEVIVEDAKGFRTREYILKKKLMKACLNIDIKEV